MYNTYIQIKEIPLSFDEVGSKLALIERSIRPFECASAILHSLSVLAGVVGSVRPALDSVALLLIVLPLALVLGPVAVEVCTLTVS
jgi:hypothetical protein